MSAPNENSFSTATSCSPCATDTYSASNDDTSSNCPYTATSCPTHIGSQQQCYDPIPDCTYPVHPDNGWDDRTCGIRQAVDAYIDSGSTGSYGPIEDWNTSLVTDMSRVFYSCGFNTEECNLSPLRSFNANISAWQVGKVTTMDYSTYTLPPSLSLQDRVFFWMFPSPLFLLTCTDFFQLMFTSFIELFFVAVLLQCLIKRMPSTVIYPHGMSGK